MSDRYVTTAAAASALGVGLTTLLRWTKEGKVTPAFDTPGGHHRWDVDALRAQLAQPVSDSPRPIVAAIVISDLGILLTQRNEGVPPWGFCTGKIEPGELAHRAAEREVMEETGLAVRAAVTIAERIHPKTKTPMTYIACHPTHGTAIAVEDADELAAVEWVTLAQADELMQPPFTMYEPVRTYLARRQDRQRGTTAEAL